MLFSIWVNDPNIASVKKLYSVLQIKILSVHIMHYTKPRLIDSLPDDVRKSKT